MSGWRRRACSERTAREVEQRAREQRLDDVDALLQTLEQETGRLRSELQAFLESKRA